MLVGELWVPRLICLSTLLHQSPACLELSRQKTWQKAVVEKKYAMLWCLVNSGKLPWSKQAVKYSKHSTAVSNVIWWCWNPSGLVTSCVCDKHSANLACHPPSWLQDGTRRTHSHLSPPGPCTGVCMCVSVGVSGCRLLSVSMEAPKTHSCASWHTFPIWLLSFLPATLSSSVSVLPLLTDTPHVLCELTQLSWILMDAGFQWCPPSVEMGQRTKE